MTSIVAEPVKSTVGVDEMLVDLVQTWQQPCCLLHRRKSLRTLLKRDVAITPLDPNTFEPKDGPMRVAGRDFSPEGLSFMHRRPLKPSVVAVSIPMNDESFQTFVMRINWCRFTKESRYLSGGIFLRETSPLLSIPKLQALIEA